MYLITIQKIYIFRTFSNNDKHTKICQKKYTFFDRFFTLCKFAQNLL